MKDRNTKAPKIDRETREMYLKATTKELNHYLERSQICSCTKVGVKMYAMEGVL